MIDFFPGDTYRTPGHVNRALSEYLLLGTRWSVYSQFVGVILKYRPLAVKGTYDDEVWALSSYDLIRRLESCGAKFDIAGMDRVRALPGPAVFVSNHMSTLETVALPGIICPLRPVTFVVKKKLTAGPVWGPIMKSRDPIVVERADPRTDLETVLREGADRLGRGISVVVFPQGTRARIFDRAAFNSIGTKLASRTGAPLVPVAVKTDFWGNSRILPGFGPVRRDWPVRIEFGEPLSISGRGKAEHDLCADFIESRLREWGAAVAGN